MKNIKDWESFNEDVDRIEVDEENHSNFEYLAYFIKSKYSFKDDIIDNISLYFSKLLNKHDWRNLKPMLEEFLNIYDGADSLYDAFESWKKSWVSEKDEENPFKKK